jgi:hypothetical protein
MGDDRADPGAGTGLVELFDLFPQKASGFPLIRILRKDLDRAAMQFFPSEESPVESSRDRKVRTEQRSHLHSGIRHAFDSGLELPLEFLCLSKNFRVPALHF